MNYKPKNTGFSLTEVLLAMGTLAVGMIFIAGVFPVGISFTTIAAERTIAAIAADEAFAKIRLYGGVETSWLSNVPPDACVNFNYVQVVPLNQGEFAYPSTGTPLAQKRYYWSALCRRVGLSDVQVTVFVSRKIGAAAKYWVRDITTGSLKESFYPVPVWVSVSQPGPRIDELLINFNVPIEKTFINDGYTIVDNKTGRIYRVLERYSPPDDDRIILLDRPWEGGPAGWVWVVPPAVGGGRYPCIAVYQKVIRF